MCETYMYLQVQLILNLIVIFSVTGTAVKLKRKKWVVPGEVAPRMGCDVAVVALLSIL